MEIRAEVAPLGRALDGHGAMKEAAQALEASFLSEMLKLSGLAKPVGEFGGGAGEEAFSSMLSDRYAEEIAAKGGIGLSEMIFNALLRRSGE